MFVVYIKLNFYHSRTSFQYFVYFSVCNIDLFCIFFSEISVKIDHYLPNQLEADTNSRQECEQKIQTTVKIYIFNTANTAQK